MLIVVQETKTYLIEWDGYVVPDRYDERLDEVIEVTPFDTVDREVFKITT